MDAATATTARAELATATGEQAWLTAVLRPAGWLDGPALRRLGTAVGQLAATSDLVLLDLSAVVVRDPRALARALREPAAGFDRTGCLLVAGATATLTTELERAGVAAVTRPLDARPAVAVPAPAAAVAVPAPAAAA